MQKRILALLLVLVMVISILPVSVLAGGLDTAKTYDELVAKLASQTVTIYVQPSENFGWPESGTLTIRANSTIQAVNDMDQKTAWEIPDGITVNFEQDCRGIECTELTINGSMHMAYSTQDSVLQGCDNVIIGPTGTFACADDNPEYPTVYTAYISAGQTWEVQAGGTLNCGVRLDGTLTGSGTVSGTVSAQGGFSGAASNGTLSGTLTLTGSAQVGQWNASAYADTLTIPAGSYISFQPAEYGSIQINPNATLILNGQLDVSGSRSGRTTAVSLQDTGELSMGAGSVLSMHYPYELSWSYDMGEDGKVPNPSDTLVTGSGTIEYHADNVSQLDRYCLFYRDITDHDMSYEDAYSGLVPTYIADSVTLWRSWSCDHTWNDGEETKPATYTEPGEKTYTCTKCGATRMEEIPAAGHTEVIDEAVAATCTEEGKTEGKHCSVCEAVIVAQESIPALGHDWSTNNCAEEATCSRCDATRAAGEHVWGNWTVDKAATCTEEGSRSHVCTSCGASESEAIVALGHAYQSKVTAPTCTEKGYTTHTCSRCGNSYQDSETAALGHDWGEWVVTKEPTETEDGAQARTCKRCGETETEPISKLAKQEVSWIVDSVTWTYGQTSSAQNTAYNDTEDGGALSYSSSDLSVATVDSKGKATIVGAGTTTITATAAAVPGKYAETSASYTLTINKAPLTITANNAAITYGQVPAGNGWTGTGYAYEEGPAVLTGTASYSYDYEQYGKAGTYEILVSGLSAKNYEITYAPGTLTVNPASEYTITLGKLEQLVGHVSAVSTQISPWDDTAEISVEYQVNNTWTADLPTEAGEYQVRAALVSSDNFTPKADAYTYGTLTIQSGSTVSVGDTTVSVGTDVSNGKAEITVSEDQLDQILGNADGDVSMDLSGVKDTDELVLPGNLINGLSKSETAGSLTVATEDASITMSGSVLDTVANAVTSDQDKVAVRLTSVSEEELSKEQQTALASISQDAVIVEVSLVITHADQTTMELHQLGGNVEVKVPYTGAVPTGKYVVVCYLSDDGNVTYVRATYDATTRQISFNTNHFSHYALFVSADPLVVVDGGSGSGTYAVGATVTIKADGKSGYRFDRWNIVSGNMELTDANSAETTFVMPDENVELQAAYIQESTGGSGAVTYAVSVDKTENGKVSVSTTRTAKGTTVTVTVKADDGYVLGTLTVTDKDGKAVELTKVSDAKYTFKMPASAVTVKATFVGESLPFTDVSGHWALDAIEYVYGNGIMNGTTSTKFGPDAQLTRGMIVTILYRLENEPTVSSNAFTDVNPSQYYANPIAWAAKNGIVTGYDETTFGPDKSITREQLAAILYRYAVYKGMEAVTLEENLVGFADSNQVSAYAVQAMNWAVGEELITGFTDNTLNPTGTATRAQVATMLMRFCENTTK